MNDTLWQRIEVFEIDDPSAGFTFSNRLAKENGWSAFYAERVVSEYKKFLYLACEAGHPVTPSEEVDQVWHLHLCYTRSYWKDLCDKTLGKEIHHGPTRGGSQERAKFVDWYERTLDSYEKCFGQKPPIDIWPQAKERFSSSSNEKVDRKLYYVIPKKVIHYSILLGLFSAVSVACNHVVASTEAIEVLDEGITIGHIWIGVIGIIILFVIIGLLFKGGGGGKGNGGCGAGCGTAGDSGSSCGGGCGGGCGGS